MLMKKTLLISILALLGMTQAAAQEYEYVPFVREGVKWVYYYQNYGNQNFPPDPNLQSGTVYLNLELKGDVVINGKTYKAMHKYYGNAINEENDTIPIYLREKDQVVYGITPDGKTYADCPIGNICEGGFIFEDIRDGNEFVLYDFQDPESYWDSHYNINGSETAYYQLLSIDTIAVGDHHVKRYTNSIGGPEPFYIIEGIGIDAPGDSYTLFPLRPAFTGTHDTCFHLSHVIENGKIIYKGIYYDPALFEIPGDVNGDGEINIADANSVIDVVVMGGNAGHTRAPAADANDDGEVNIGDINYIINIILNGE